VHETLLTAHMGLICQSDVGGSGERIPQRWGLLWFLQWKWCNFRHLWALKNSF